MRGVDGLIEEQDASLCGGGGGVIVSVHVELGGCLATS